MMPVGSPMTEGNLDGLRQASVGIAGAGGLGSHVAMALARAGVGRLVVVDYDLVEERNLSRQCYFIDQVGMPKVEALRRNVERAAPGVTVETHQTILTEGEMIGPFADVDMVVEALDDAATKARFIEEVMTGLPGTPIVAASGVGGWGGSERIRLRQTGSLHLVEDPQGRSCEEVI
ncbi:MAG TPA: sulfur carrier protein ThiS adenylyltransferase ThiF, partial [Thermoplasmata archaeon]|nr:sulfur carrier protein ThiS adenylyltransferase ThiF [Thermoplasmata archaeon]